jgi:hypothetical protein
MEDLEFDIESDNELNNYQEELDYLPNLTLKQEEHLETIEDTLEKVETLLKMINIPLSDDAEPDLSHMKQFYIEDNINDLYYRIKERTEHIGLYKHLSSFDLLYFLHPNHDPPF